MAILVYNTISRKKEEFVPLNNKQINIYVCGITPYDDVHLGHARVYVLFDVIRRHLEHSGFNVYFIQNFTDVDDKIIKRAKELKIKPSELADRYIKDYFVQMDKLIVKRANIYPLVTKNIPQIIKFIEVLINKGYAYVVNGNVYFSVKSFKEYGKLSGRNIEELKAGVRIEINEEKRDTLDFALWKAAKPEEPDEVIWESPWGKGRPGWHIECSVMSIDAAGPTLDIHGGGQDLIFPHHENEIAQSESATDKTFVRYWIHNGFVTINKEKMSKSLGNFFTLKDIFKRYSPRTVRYFLLSQHYRNPLDFSEDKLLQAENALKGIDSVYLKLKERCVLPIMPTRLPDLNSYIEKDVINKFMDALNDDFNTEKSLAVLHDFKGNIISTMYQKSPQILYNEMITLKVILEDHLGISVPQEEDIPQEVIDLKIEREKARQTKDWATADAIRKKLDVMGWIVEDLQDGKSTLIKKRY